MKTKKLLHRVAYAVALWLVCSLNAFAAEEINLATVSSGGTGYTFADNVLTITANGEYTITSNGEETTRRVVVAANVTATVTISNLNISVESKEHSAFTLATGANVTLIVAETDTLKAASDDINNAPGMYGSGAAINVPEGASIIIQGTGALYAESGGHSAVIGGAHAPGTDTDSITKGEKCGNITITGDVTLTVNSKFRGPAIGSGAGGAELGGDIKILAGTATGFPVLDLTVEMDAPVIGSTEPHTQGNNYVIEIAGGTVAGHAEHDIAYIGCPESCWYLHNSAVDTAADGSPVNQNPKGSVTVGYNTVKISGGKVTLGTIIAASREISGGTVALTSGFGAVGFSYNVMGTPFGRVTNTAQGTLTISGGSVNIATLDESLQPTDGTNNVYLNALTLVDASANAAVTAATVGGADYTGVNDVVTDEAGKVYLWLPASSNDDVDTVSLTAGDVEYKRAYARPAAPVAKNLLSATHPYYTVTFDTNGGSATDPQQVAEGEAAATPVTPAKGGAEFGGWYADAEFAQQWDFATPITQETTLYAQWLSSGVINLATVSNDGAGYTFADGVLTITAAGEYTITSNGAETDRRVVVAAGVATTITISNLKVSVVDDSLSAFTITPGDSVTLNVEGDNSIVAASTGYLDGFGSGAAINVPEGASITIQGTGALHAASGGFAAAIGGAHAPGNDATAFTTGEKCGDITITGNVALTVNSVFRGPAIGSGAGGAELGGDIRILAGATPGYPVLDLTVVQDAPVIGSSAPQSEGNPKIIEIAGGMVTGRASNDVAYIGNPESAWNQNPGSPDGQTVSPDNVEAIGYSKVVVSGGKVILGTIVAKTKEITGGTVTLTEGLDELLFSYVRYTNVGSLGTLTISGGSVNIAALDESLQPTSDGSTSVYLNELTLVGAPANAAVTSATVGGAAYTGIADVETDGASKVYLWLPASDDDNIDTVSLTANSVEYSRAYDRPAATVAKNLLSADHTFHTVTFINGDVTVTTTSVAEGEAVDEPEEPTPSAEQEGKAFSGWYTENDFTQRWNFADAVTSAITLYAGWKSPYHVTFISGAAQNTVPVFDGEKVAPPERPGYNIDGWYTDADFTPGNQWNFEASVVTGNITLYAKWEAIEYYIIYYDVDGAANDNNPATYTVELLPITLSAPVKEGYDFSGWEDYYYSPVTAIEAGATGDLSLYAVFTPTEYTITYNLDDGTNAVDNPTTYTIESGDIILLPSDKVGYFFDGWYDAGTGGSQVTNIPAGNTGDIELWARWSTTPVYNITYNLDGGTNADSNPDTYTGSEVITLLEPTRAGYAFDGWFDAATDGNKVTAIAAGSTGNAVLYARWTLINYSITYSNEEGATNNNPTTYNVESGEIVLQPLTRADYFFVGWYDAEAGGNQVPTIATGTTSNVTLYARWLSVAGTINLATVADGSYTGYTFADGVLTITEDGEYLITSLGEETNRRVVVADSVTATVTISNLSISVASKELSAFTLAAGDSVTLVVEGTNSLKAASDDTNAPGLYGSGAAINVPEGASITIQGTGALYAESGGHSAVIGGAHAPGADVDAITTGEKCGDITITGDVTLTVNSKFRGTAIGSGANGAELGGDIKILAGTAEGFPVLDLTIEQDAPVIGSSAPQSEGNPKVIEIAGGTVTGHATYDIAYIGNPESAWNQDDQTVSPDSVHLIGYSKVVVSGGKVNLGTIVAKTKEITGGTVTLTEGLAEFGFSINGGWWAAYGEWVPQRYTNVGSLGTLTISGGSVNIAALDENLQPVNAAATPVYLNTLTLSVKDSPDAAPSHPANAAVTAATVGGAAYTGIADVETDENGKVYLWLPASSGDIDTVSLTANGVEYKRGYARPAAPIARFLVAGDGYPFHTVTFINGSDPIATPLVAEGEAVDEPENPAGEEGIAFVGWYTAADVVADSTRWDFANPVTSNTALYAGWKAVYKVIFVTDAARDTVIVLDGDKVAPPAGRPGYALEGCYANAEFTPSSQWSFDTSVVTSDTTLYAKWTAIVYDIYYYEVEGAATNDNPATYTVENLPITLSNPVKAGYDFAGWWFIGGEYDDWVYLETPIIEAGATGELYLSAEWTLKTYTITYNLDGGDTVPGTPATFTVESDTITLLPTAKTGYTFAGWYDAETDGSQVTAIATGTTGNLELWARWTAIPYTITYNLDGGANAAGNPATYTVEDTITLADPTKEGYTFAGWYDAETGGSQVTAIATGSTGDVELWARWTENEAKTGVESVTTATLSVYPNPTTSIVNVASDGDEVLLYSATGALLKRTREAQLDLSGYPSGIYVLKAGKKTTKVVKVSRK